MPCLLSLGHTIGCGWCQDLDGLRSPETAQDLDAPQPLLRPWCWLQRRSGGFRTTAFGSCTKAVGRRWRAMLTCCSQSSSLLRPASGSAAMSQTDLLRCREVIPSFPRRRQGRAGHPMITAPTRVAKSTRVRLWRSQVPTRALARLPWVREQKGSKLTGQGRGTRHDPWANTGRRETRRPHLEWILHRCGSHL